MGISSAAIWHQANGYRCIFAYFGVSSRCSSYDGPLPQLSRRGPYFAYLTDSRKIFSCRSFPVPVCSTVDNLHSLRLIWILGEGIDQPVQWFLDTLHRHYARYTDRPYGGKPPKDIDRISSLFYYSSHEAYPWYPFYS